MYEYYYLYYLIRIGILLYSFIGIIYNIPTSDIKSFES